MQVMYPTSSRFLRSCGDSGDSDGGTGDSMLRDNFGLPSVMITGDGACFSWLAPRLIESWSRYQDMRGRDSGPDPSYQAGGDGHPSLQCCLLTPALAMAGLVETQRPESQQ